MSPLFWMIVVIFSMVAAIGVLGWRRPAALGFKGKTLWDWIELLLIPGMVGLGGMAISVSQYLVEQDRAKEEGLRNYFDRISALSAEADATDTGRMAAIARAQTQAILRSVEGERAGRVLGFLSDIGLLADLDIEFEGLDLRGAEMKGMDLSGVDFEDVDLSGVDLEGSRLVGTDFEHARLVDADLKGADLRGAGFEGADLRGADLDHADLRGANLFDAVALGARQLAEACLDETTRLPSAVPMPPLPAKGCTGLPADDD